MLVTRHRSGLIYVSATRLEIQPTLRAFNYGYNYRLSNICAAIGLGQMKVLDDRVARRRKIFDRYKAKLARDGINFMPEPKASIQHLG